MDPQDFEVDRHEVKPSFYVVLEVFGIGMVIVKIGTINHSSVIPVVSVQDLILPVEENFLFEED